MLATSAQFEVLDLRHFSAPALRPLLQEEAAKWERRLSWDYSRSVELLLDYVNSRSLTGYVAVRQGRVAGYAFGVCEATKAVMGDVYAFGEGEGASNPVCEVLLDHLIETLQSTPGITRIESQLLLFPDLGLSRPFMEQDFRAFPRCFMLRDLADGSVARKGPGMAVGFRIDRWQPESYLPAAKLIQEAYLGHTDADINDQYRTVAGAQRFLHNIVHSPDAACLTRQIPGYCVMQRQVQWMGWFCAPGCAVMWRTSRSCVCVSRCEASSWVQRCWGTVCASCNGTAPYSVTDGDREQCGGAAAVRAAGIPGAASV